ncbi:hypothetical protein PAMP_008606 [Pampus punctatissimus]
MAATASMLSRGLGLVLVEFQYEYQGRDGALVSIKPNERYILLAKTNEHWWQVRGDSGSRPFYIPAKYVRELPLDFPSPLDFTDPPSPEPLLLPVVAPVPVLVPVPKTLEELSETKSKPGDEVTIRLRPDVSTGHRKSENRMSTFGVPLDFQDLTPLMVPSHRHPTNPPVGPAELGTTTTDETTNMGSALRKKEHHISGVLDDHEDSRKPRVPSFSPADPLHTPRPMTQPIPVETPVVPTPAPHGTTSPGCHDDQECPIELEEESSEEEDSLKGDDSNHIYESIQDLNLDLEALTSPGAPSELAPPPSQDRSSLGPNSPIYANVSSLKKTAQICISGPAIPAPSVTDVASSAGHTPSSSSSSSFGMINPTSPLSLHDEWQVHTDQDSGKQFYYNPATQQTTWSDPRSPLPPPAGDIDQSKGTEGGNLASPSPVSSQFQQLPQRLMGNGVSEERTHLQVRNWRHSVAEDLGWDPQAPHHITLLELTAVQKVLLHSSPQLSGKHNTTVVAYLNKQSDPQPCTDAGIHPDLGRPPSLLLKAHHVPGSSHLLEKAGIINKTKVADHGKKIRKNWTQSWTVLHGGILTFHKDPKSAPTGNAMKASQIVPEYTVELRGASVSWASKDKSSKKNVLELKTRQGCEYLMQYDTESIISDWLKVMQDAIKQLEHEHLSEDEDEAASDKEDKDRKRTLTSSSSAAADSEQRRVRTKLRRFLQRRPTLQSVKERGYIRDNVFGCHLDTLCHRENSNIPKFVEKCIRTVERRGLDVDGIYRVSGNLAVIQKLRHKADHEEQLDLEDGQWEEIHVITGALKLFLRELPEPLFPFSCFDKFIAAIQVPDYSLKVSYMKDLVRLLPLPNHDTMELLFKHLRRVIDHKDSNRMSVQSIAIVFGPTLLRPQTESANMTIHMVFQSQIVELMLNEYQIIFSSEG